jgi:hypothetical protein
MNQSAITVQAVLDDAHCPDIGESRDQPLGHGRIRSDEGADDAKDDQQEDTAEYASQPSPAEDAALILSCQDVIHDVLGLLRAYRVRLLHTHIP